MTDTTPDDARSAPRGDLRGVDLRDADLHGADFHAADLSGADLRGANLQQADLRAANLTEATLRGADLRGARLQGAQLQGADLRETMVHGADLRETTVGSGHLDHPGGDPELTLVFDPSLHGMRADDTTLWTAVADGTWPTRPTDFVPWGKGVLYDGPAVLGLVGAEIHLPADVKGPERWEHRKGQERRPLFRRCRVAVGSTVRRLVPFIVRKRRVYEVVGWAALVSTGRYSTKARRGTTVLRANLVLLVGQPLRLDGEDWIVVQGRQGSATLVIERAGHRRVVRADDVFARNVDRWWWHVPGSERS